MNDKPISNLIQRGESETKFTIDRESLLKREFIKATSEKPNAKFIKVESTALVGILAEIIEKLQ